MIIRVNGFDIINSFNPFVKYRLSYTILKKEQTYIIEGKTFDYHCTIIFVNLNRTQVAT